MTKQILTGFLLKKNLEGQCQDVKHKAVLNSEKGDIPEHKGMPPLSSSSGL